MNVEFNTEDGFISQECPSCELIFKTEPGKGSPKPLSFCPYCGHEERDCWWTKEQADYLSSVAVNKFIKPQMDEVMRGFNRKAGGFLKITAKSSVSPVLSVPDEPAQGWPVTDFKCCGERLRLDPAHHASFCPICGTRSTP